VNSRGDFLLAVFYRVTHGGKSERGATRSLTQYASVKYNKSIYFRN